MFQITTQFDIINFQCENIDFLYFLFIFSLKIRLDTYLTLNQAAIIIVREKKNVFGFTENAHERNRICSNVLFEIRDKCFAVNSQTTHLKEFRTHPKTLAN